MTWAVFLLSMVQPLIIQALIALGIGVLTVTGLDLALNTALSWVTTAVGGFPSDVANVLALAGVFQGASYVCGAFTARVALAGAGAIKKWFFQ